MKTANTALISIKTFSSQGVAMMRSVLQELQKNLKLKELSSVYKVNRKAESLAGLRDIRKEEHLECFAIVVKVETQSTPGELLDQLQHIEKGHQKEYLRRSVSMNLMLYDDEIILLPGLALPHPEMHLRPEEIVLATEISGETHHPVLKNSLAQLAIKFADENWGEFFAQGTTLLDLSGAKA